MVVIVMITVKVIWWVIDRRYQVIREWRLLVKR